MININEGIYHRADGRGPMSALDAAYYEVAYCPSTPKRVR